MIGISVRGIRNTMKGLEREKDRIISEIAQDTLDVAVKNTPIDEGRARAGWRRENTGTGFRIANRVPYIDLLEKGRSKQAPNGILGPTVREISRRRYK